MTWKLFTKVTFFKAFIQCKRDHFIFLRKKYIHTHAWASLVVQSVKNLPAVQETQVQSLGQEDPLEKGMATTPIWKSYKQRSLEEPVHGMARVGHDLAMKPPPRGISSFFEKKIQTYIGLEKMKKIKTMSATMWQENIWWGRWICYFPHFL